MGNIVSKFQYRDRSVLMEDWCGETSVARIHGPNRLLAYNQYRVPVCGDSYSVAEMTAKIVALDHPQAPNTLDSAIEALQQMKRDGLQFRRMVFVCDAIATPEDELWIAVVGPQARSSDMAGLCLAAANKFLDHR